MTIYNKILGILIAFFFFASTLPHQAFSFENTVLTLPAPGMMVAPSKPLVPVMLKGLQINPKDPLIFDFLVSKGDVAIENEQYTQEIERLARYFLASMAIPEEELWVNLSPFEKENIISDSLSKTEMGQNMLAQDYLLKQLTASMIYPEKELGKKFWGRVYEQVKVRFGDVNIPVNTFNKVWILADTANAVEKDNAVVITDAHLKVMLEEDFLAIERHQGRVAADLEQTKERKAVSNIVRQIIVPEIEKEVNEGANFAPIRQVFNAFVLSVWFKKNLKQSILNEVYADKSKLGGIEANDLNMKQKIYERYVQAYKKGVFNYIKDTDTRGVSEPRKYFSGGAVIAARKVNIVSDSEKFNDTLKQPIDKAQVSFAIQTDKAMANLGNTQNVVELTNAKKIKGFAEFLEKSTIKDVTKEHITDEVRRNLESKVVAESLEADSEEPARVVLVDNNFLRYGYAVDKELKRIYIDHNFQNKIKLKRNSEIDYHDRLFHFIERKLIYIDSSSEDRGREREYEYIVQNEVLHELMRSLFPPEAQMPEDLKKRARDMLLGIKFKGEIKDKKLKIVAEAIVGDDPRHYEIFPPTENDIETNEAIYELAKRSYDTLAINAMDGVADYHHPLSSDPKDLLNLQTPIDIVEFSSKFNPITIAQSFVTMLAVHVQSGADGYFYDISQFDPRKPEVSISHRVRKLLTIEATEELFGNLMTFLDLDGGKGKLVSGINLREWNGEEMFYLLFSYALSINHKLSGSRFLYTAGSDHFYVWSPMNGKKESNYIQFDSMDEDVRKFYTFYVDVVEHGASNYANLIERQFKLPKSQNARLFYEDDNNSENIKKKNFIQAILAAKRNGAWDEERIKEIVKGADMLPRLDTFGKLYMFQRGLEKTASIVLVHTRRAIDLGEDRLRDEMVAQNELKVLEIESLKLNIAATNTRRALILFLYGIIDLGRLSGNTLVALKKILHIENRGEMLDFILRQNNVTLAHSIQLMMFPESAQNKSIIEKAKTKLLEKLGEGWDPLIELDDPIQVTLQGEVLEGTGLSRIIARNSKKNEYIEISYQVQSSFDKNGLASNKLVNVTISSPKKRKKEEKEKINQEVEEILNYIRSIENINDAAMIATNIEIDSSVLKGGIELSQNDLQLNIRKDGQGVSFEFDSELLRQLQSEDFGGFKPTVLGITPMSVANPKIQ